MQSVVEAVLRQFPDVRPDDVAVVGVNPAGEILHFRGDVNFYPASVVKLFFLAAGGAAIQNGTLVLSADGENAFREMITESDNDATALVVDLLTGTTSGPDLDAEAFEIFRRNRDSVNRLFSERGYSGLNLCQKTWSFGPYGRDRQLYETEPGLPLSQACGTGAFVNRNSITPLAATRLMREVLTGEFCDQPRSAWMRKILERQPGGDTQDEDFIGAVLPSDARRWSKAGWTSTTRHDVAHVQFADGREITVAVFTNDHASRKDLLQSLAQAAIESILQ